MHKVYSVERETSKGIYGLRVETDKDSNDYQSRSCMARCLDEGLVKQLRNREKQEWKHEKPKLDNAQRLSGIYFTDPDEPRVQRNSGKTYGTSHVVENTTQ